MKDSKKSSQPKSQRTKRPAGVWGSPYFSLALLATVALVVAALYLQPQFALDTKLSSWWGSFDTSDKALQNAAEQQQPQEELSSADVVAAEERLLAELSSKFHRAATAYKLKQRIQANSNNALPNMQKMLPFFTEAEQLLLTSANSFDAIDYSKYLNHLSNTAPKTLFLVRVRKVDDKSFELEEFYKNLKNALLSKNDEEIGKLLAARQLEDSQLQQLAHQLAVKAELLGELESIIKESLDD